ncbi:MAG: TraR/DksA C4-type zinc finger protein [Bacteroidales bacterium]
MDDIDCANERGQLYIDSALAFHATLARRNAAPSTGVCRSCGELIERERLRVNAHARDCFDCASEHEVERLRVRRRGTL